MLSSGLAHFLIVLEYLDISNWIRLCRFVFASFGTKKSVQVFNQNDFTSFTSQLKMCSSEKEWKKRKKLFEL